MRPTRAEIDLEAVRHNTRLLQQRVAPAAVLAVVKADGYGHGAVPVAGAAVDAGATWLGVALVEEGIALRHAGFTEPILVLSAPHPMSMADLVEAGLTATVYTPEGIEALARAAAAVGARVAVHLKLDTGMHRVGARPDDAVALARAVVDAPGLHLQGVCTHLAVADELDRDDTAGQLARFEAALAALADAGCRPEIVHAANSAGAIAHPDSRFDLVRCGIALYGLPPGPQLAGVLDLRPAMRLVSEVSFVKQVPAGTAVSYGLRYRTTRPTVLATVPVGYADGIPRRLGSVGGEVLVGGRRRPIAGAVTMDQIVVDCGPDDEVAVGDPVVLLGRQGDSEITAGEWAERLDTIGYEIVTRIGPRVPRVYVGQ